MSKSTRTVLGKVGILLRGEYDSNVSYKRLDGVTYNGSFFICRKDCQGIPVENTDYWQLSAKSGEKPKNHIDYNTEEEKAEFKKEIIDEATSEVGAYIDERKSELDIKTEELKSELSETESELEIDLVKKKDELIKEVENAQVGFDEHVSEKISAFDDNASDKAAAFDTNAETKTSAFDTNAETKTSAFNTNASDKTSAFNANAESKTSAFNTNASEKTASFNQNASDKVAEFDDVKDGLLGQADDLFDALTTNEISGTELYIDDAKACRVINSEIDGMYQQETTSGKNLLEVVATSQTLNGITFTINEDKTITANGTATGTAFFVIGTFSFIANTNYILNGCPTGGAITTYHILIADTANAYDIGNGYNCVFTEDTTKNIVIRVQKGVTVNNIVFKPMIIKGSQATDFEPYTGRSFITKSGLSAGN